MDVCRMHLTRRSLLNWMKDPLLEEVTDKQIMEHNMSR